ncbi:MAG: NACHT domain-containing protein [Myxococcota bacterium]
MTDDKQAPQTPDPALATKPLAIAARQRGRAGQDFTEKVKRVLADRVGGICSKRGCGKPTRGPHSDEDKVVNIGKASHIHAASPNGPRYDPNQSPRERKSAANGIWLCADCATDVDADAKKYPADLLKGWKAEAERRAAFRLDLRSQNNILQALRESTSGLLSWPQHLPGGAWLERPAMNEIRAILTDEKTRVLALLGAPGSGKSALLARLSGELATQGWNVVAIKADRLPAGISNLRGLEYHLGIEIPLTEAIYALSRTGKTVLILDQLDALSDLVDLRTERLSALLALVSETCGYENLNVICSVRDFDFRHDSRFAQLHATEVRLEPLSDDDVDQVLKSFGMDSARMTAKLKTLLALPHWLNVFVGLPWDTASSLPTSWQALLEKFWEYRVLAPAENAVEHDRAVDELARTIFDTEELWVPRARLARIEPSLQRLLAAGVFSVDPIGSRISFAHQSLYEFARARAFVASESLAAHVIARQDSLFVRPTVWTSLQYLREVDQSRYAKEVSALWTTSLRPHLRLLLIEFVAQLSDPDESEIRLLMPTFQDPRWMAAAFNAVSRSRAWLRRIRHGPLKSTMLGACPSIAYGAIVASLRTDRDETLSLLAACWKDVPERAGLVLSVLRQLDDWNDDARDLASNALSLDENIAAQSVDSLGWQLKKKAPVYAIQLISESLQRTFDRLEGNLPRTPEPAETASPEDRIRWHSEREPRETIRKVLGEVSQIHALNDLAKAAPEQFVRTFLPWVERVLAHAAEAPRWRRQYRVDYVFDCSRDDFGDRGFPQALRSAIEILASSNAEQFWSLCSVWSSSDLHAIHLLLSYGIELAGSRDPFRVVNYLLGDVRRFQVGEFSDDDVRTIAVLHAIQEVVGPDDSARLEQAVLAAEFFSEATERPAESRAIARQLNREHRARLLKALPSSFLSAGTAAMLEQELRALGEVSVPRSARVGPQPIESPMSSRQMERARDDHILRLFEGLPDSTRYRHPKRFRDGGAVEASREFGQFARLHPERAIKIIAALSPQQNELPVGDGIDALAETNLSTSELFSTIAGCHARGFSSEQFRIDAARALGKRAKQPGGLPQEAIALFAAWLADTPTRERTISRLLPDDHSGHPPFLAHGGGAFDSPGGNYPILQTLTDALLGAEPARKADWLELLGQHAARDEQPAVWKAFAHSLRWLGICDRRNAEPLLITLIDRYPEILETSRGVVLLAISSRWVRPSTVKKWVRALDISSWQYAKQAVAEVITVLATKRRGFAWAERTLASMLDRNSVEHAVGVAHAVANLWHNASDRDVLALYMRRLVALGHVSVDELLLRSLAYDERSDDDATASILAAFANREAPFPLVHAHDAVTWTSKLVHQAPESVCIFLERLVSTASDPAALPLGMASAELVNAAVTLQRIHGFRDRGLTLFERLLELNIHGVREALDNIDLGRKRNSD